MSFVRATPDRLVTAARNLAGIGSTLNASNATAAAPTLAVSAAASDQVSAAVAAFFSGHAQGYQTLSAQAAEFHSDFVQALSADANSYASAESDNAAPLRQLFNATPETTPLGAGEAAGAGTKASAIPGGVPPGTGRTRGGTANPRAVTAVGPVGSAVAKGTGSSTEGGAPAGNCGTGGLLLRAGGVSEPGVSWSTSAVRAGASGGLLSRLVDADGGNARTGDLRRVNAGTRNGVWLDGIRGAGLALGGNHGGAAGGSAKLVGLWGAGTPVDQRGPGTGGINGS